MNLMLAAAAAACYLLAAFGVWRGRGRVTPLGLFSAAALALHAWVLLIGAFNAGQLTLGVTEALSLFAWQAAFMLWLFCLFQPLQVLSLVLFPVAAAAALASAFLPTSGTAIPLSEWKIQLHVVLSLFSAGFLTLAVVQAATLALQDRLLHHATPGRTALSLPPLQTMERVLFQLIGLGFFVLSLSLVTGLLFVDNLLAQHLAHKTVLSCLAWGMFGVLLWGRWRWGWRGRSAIRWTFTSYGLLILAYFGSKLVLEQVLNRHWN